MNNYNENLNQIHWYLHDLIFNGIPLYGPLDSRHGYTVSDDIKTH